MTVTGGSDPGGHYGYNTLLFCMDISQKIFTDYSGGVSGFLKFRGDLPKGGGDKGF